MNKSDVINVLRKKQNLTEKQAMDIVNLMFEGFANELKNGGRIEIRGFGSFAVRKYDAHKCRNPRTGKIVDVKQKRLPLFKAGRELKKMVNV